jgi:acyl transferase domain-containing protein
VSALHEAGVLDAASLVKVARRRGELMRDASAVPGAMTAVAKAIDEVRAAVAESGANVVVANHNSPTQVVLSGSVEEITKVEAALGAKGMTAKRLPVATAFHSPLVAGSSVPFGEFLQGVAFNAPLLDVYSNATAASYATEPAAIRTQLAAQLAQSVRFVEQIEAMYASGVRTFVEVGAGSVLTELVGRILGERPHRAISLDRKGKHGVTTLQEGLGRLALAGVAMDFAPLWAQFAPASDKPVKKPAMTMPICGANTGSPYPPPGGAKALPPPNPPRALPVAPEPIIIRETVVVHEPAPAQAAAFVAAPVFASEAVHAPALAGAPVAETPAAQSVAVAQAPAVAAVAPAVSMAPDAHLAWVQAFQDTQRQTAEAHAAYQRAMADSHMAFLKTAESSYAGLGAMLGNTAPVQQTWQPMPAATAPLAPAVLAPVAPVASVAPAAPVLAASAPAPVAVQAVVADQAVPAPVAPVVAVVNAPVPVVAPVAVKSAPVAVAEPVAAAAPSIDMEALMMAIVAEKTGYPQEMLGIEMELEADLGIDSIKRVEILSAMRERAPNLPEVKPTELATLRTLGQIIDHMRAAGGAALAAAPVAANAAVPVAAAPAAPGIDLEALMMAIVAEKTGYPQEMLGVQMELEADLGIDSIKRVEILSAMRERAPNLPEVKPTELAALRTLGQIIDHMRAGGGSAMAAAPAAAQGTPVSVAADASAKSAGPSIDLEALMMAIVAEKTGYPQEMLGVQMELEADLGIDSIKRVEILSAMRERAPNLPEVKPTELAALRTLGQIIDHMRAAGGAALAAATAVATSTPASVAANASRESAGVGIDLENLMMSIVAEKTGYPQEMLGVQMELEADLGIDSIKRVEILSAMRERAPNLPEVKPTELAALRTLGQIIDHMRAAGGAALAAAPAAATSTRVSVAADAIAESAGVGIDIENLMMSIVAEKTGYPQEMLGVQMELEADLGIDSIKRVEILSAMRERAPNLPEVKPTELAALRTLGQIIDHMRAAGTPAPAATAATVATPATALADVDRFAVREVAASPVGMALSGVLGAQRLVVTDEGTGVAQAVVAALAQQGVAASVVASVPADADAVVFLGGLRSVATVDEAVAVNREAFQASRAVAARLTAQGGAFVTVQDTGGDFGLSGVDGTRAYLGGVSALARTAALEWPKAAVKAIDLARGTRTAAELAQALVTELLQGGNTLEVGLRADGQRSTLASVLTPSPSAAADNIGKTSVVVASGGARGVTAACLIALAQAKQPRIVLLGRTALADEPEALRGLADEAGLKRALLQRAQAQGVKPTPADINAQLANVLALREVRATLSAMQAAGSDARYLAVDVADAAVLGAALDSVRQDWGPITALVHGAGVLADKRIEDKTDAQFDRVFDTKVSGLRALLAATANDPLTAVCLFSSVAARSGNLGQCDYAMANEVLNLVACAEQARRGAGCVVRAIGWGPWDGGMVTPSLKSHFEHMGVALIPLAAGAQRFVDELTCRSDVTQIVIGGAQGDGALGASVTPQANVDVRVSQASHPYLADHAIAGVPVVPMVLAVEWFMRAAKACRPDLVASAVKQVKVLRGIKLAQFAGAGDCFAVRARQVAEGGSVGTGAEIAVELRGQNDVLHYSATVTMTAQPVAAPALAAAPELQDWIQPAVYDGHVLFHGPSFQVINAVQGVSRYGIVGTLAGTSQAGWPTEAWCSDAASLDGGLQLALLWSHQVLGGAVLPMALGEYRSYRSGLATGPVTGVVHGRQIHDARTVCDMAFVDGNGQVVAELIGVETVLRPDAAPATPAQAA